jgi:copper chaperone
MANFIVNDMTCGHCVAAITRALNAVDPHAVVTIDLGPHRVRVDSTLAAAALSAAIAGAGYSPEPEVAQAAAAAGTAKAGGCGSGCGCR